jgi:hypothetical protein
MDLKGNARSFNASVKNPVLVSPSQAKRLKIFGQALQTLVRHSTILPYTSTKGHAVAKLVEALYYKPDGRGFDSR